MKNPRLEIQNPQQMPSPERAHLHPQGGAGCPQPAANQPEPAPARKRLRVLCCLLFSSSVRQLAVFCFLLSTFCFCAQAQLAIDWSTIDGGGGISTGGVFTVTGTIGQPDAGKMSGGNFALDGGFWGVVAAVQTPGAPLLTITLNSQLSTITVSWPSPSPGWTLQQNTNAIASANWSSVTNGIQDNGTEKFITVTPPTGNRFYRLHKS